MVSIDKERCRRSFKEFVRRGWHVLEPNRSFVDNWHIDAICEHLEAITAGQLKRLLILVPPGSMKSLSVSVFWPAWQWGPQRDPFRRFMFSSYAQHLSDRDSIRCRRLIQSNWYQERWGNVFELVEDRNTVRVFQNNHMGHRLATSTTGVSTGERSDVVVVDDPHSVVEVESEVQRQSVLHWWDEAMSNRVDDMENSPFIIIMQRLHQEDLAGHIIEQGGYEQLVLPMEFEPDRACHTLVRPKSYKGNPQSSYLWDPRQEEGELLWPERNSAAAVADLKKRMGSYASATQLQQRPAPRGGGLIKLDWFGRYGTPPSEFRMIVQSWDTANKGGQENAYSVCTTWGITDSAYYLLHVFRERMNIPQLKRTVISNVDACELNWGSPHALLIEEAASGVALIQYLQEETTLPVLPVRPDKDKVTRMDVETPAIEAGNVLLPEHADWLNDYEAELRDFPNVKYKDQVDSTSQFLHWAREEGGEDDWDIY